jgi:hypothetical protein
MISNTLGRNGSVLLLLALALSAFAFNSVQGSHEHDHHGNEFYVYSNRKGCMAVQSQPLCPSSQLNPWDATNYIEYIRDMQGILDEFEASNTNNSECITAFKAAYCSKLTPKCFEDGSKDFRNGNSACWKANTTCDNLVILDFEEFCQSIPNGKQFLDECILPSSRIEGSCPQPEYQVRIIQKHTTCLV